MVALLCAAGMLPFPATTGALGLFRGNQPAPIVHGGRPFEKPYTRRVIPGAWKTLPTQIDDDLVAVSAVDAMHAWVTGAAGGIYRTQDGGETFEPLVGVDAAAYEQIAWTSPERGYAISREGRLFRSDDGGTSWRRIVVRDPRRLRTLAFPTPAEGWVAGDRGLLLHTRDGGESWDTQNPDGTDDLGRLQMLSVRTGWAGGESALLRTENGGARWGPSGAFKLWTFVSGRRGYASDGEAIYATEDAGRKWHSTWHLATGATSEALARRRLEEEGEEVAPAGAGGVIVRIDFVDRYNGIAETLIGGQQVIFRTQSLGRVWKRVYEAERGGPDELVTISMSNGNHGWAIDGEGNLRATTDGARSWPVQVSAHTFDLADVVFLDARNGWAVGLSGEVLVTDDGGARWREAPRRVTTPLRRLRVLRAATGEARAWAVGDQGTILSSPSGGRAWRTPWRAQQSRTTRDLRGLAMRDSSTGVAVGDAGVVARTGDGGATWLPGNAGVQGALDAVIFADPARVLVGGEGALLGSTDGGRSFTAEPVAPGDLEGTVVDLAAPDARTFFALVAEGRLLRSRDGGKRWESLPLVPGARFVRLAFIDARRGWALAEREKGGAVVCITSDGGETWRERELPASPIRALHFVDGTLGFAVGRQTILVTRDGGENWRRQAIGSASAVRAFTFLKDGRGFAVGDNGLVLRYAPPGPREKEVKEE